MVKQFTDITDRKWALHTPEARFLRKNLPTGIWDGLERFFLETGLNSPEAAAVLDYLHQNSEIARCVRIRPSDALPFEMIYRKKPPSTPVDRFCVRSKGALGIYLRLLALKDILPDIIRCELDRNPQRKENFIVLDLFSGPSHYMLEVLHENPDLAERVQVQAVDYDRRALDIGEKRAEHLGVRDSFMFIHEAAEKVPPAGAHLVLLIGILCPLATHTGTKLVGAARQHILEKGLIIYSTVQQPMLYGDPLLDALMRGMNWTMDYKSEKEAESMGTAADYHIEGAFHDALGYNRMTIGRISHQASTTDM